VTSASGQPRQQKPFSWDASISIKGAGLIAANPPANDDEQASVLVSQAPGEKIAVATVSLRKALPQAAAPASVIIAPVIVLFVQSACDAFPKSIAQVRAAVATLLKQIHEHVAPVSASLYPISQEVTQVSVPYGAIAVAPFLLLSGGGRGHCANKKWRESDDCQYRCSNDG
jgi:hypothetical protein